MARDHFHERLLGIGITPERLAALGVSAPAPNIEARDDGINPAGIARAAHRERARQLAERAVQDIGFWRAYRDATGFERARLRREHSGAVERGRELDESVEELKPPKGPAEAAEAAGRVLDMLAAIGARTNPNEPPPSAA